MDQVSFCFLLLFVNAPFLKHSSDGPLTSQRSLFSPDYEPIKKMLKLQSNDHLAFVYQILYNNETVTLSNKAGWKHNLS